MSEQERPHQLDPDAYRSLVEGVPAILYIDEVDDLSSNRYTSPQVVELLGFTPDEWSGDPDLWLRQLHPEDRAGAMAAHRRSNETGERFFAEYRLLARDGRVVWLRDEAALVRDEAERPLYWRGVMQDVTEQKQAEEQLRWSLDVLRRTVQQRRDLAQRLEGAQEQERRRIAADIHDDSIQVMSAVDMRLQMLARLGSGADTAKELGEIQGIVHASIERLRHLLFELRPLALDREGLAVALRQYLQHTAESSGWTWDVVDQLDREPPPDLRAIVYRIAQEAISNANKHAHPSHVQVVLAGDATGISVAVRDDGQGFDTAAALQPQPGHLGLATMVERAELTGGQCRLVSTLGDGTTVEAWVPLDAETSRPEATQPTSQG
ncbi:MAG: PAS domain-containing protein [Actinobacteria bacterium]|nr:PAS domain-containing protein [Actinomycetota bacterium]